MTLPPQEDRLLRKLGDSLLVVQKWQAIVDDEAAKVWKATAGSDLETDDAASDPITVSSGAWTAISAAISHLGTLRDSLFHFVGPTNVKSWLHPYGQPSLVRGALENSSRAVWLLMPDSRQERILRRIQTDADERRQLMRVITELGQEAGRTSTKDHEDRMIKILDRVGADSSKLRPCPGYGDIVRTAGERSPAGATVAFVIWKACSALAHGELRGSIAYLDLLSASDSGNGMRLNHVGPNIALLVTGAHAALATTRDALNLYAQRSGTPNSA